MNLYFVCRQLELSGNIHLINLGMLALYRHIRARTLAEISHTTDTAGLHPSSGNRIPVS